LSPSSKIGGIFAGTLRGERVGRLPSDGGLDEVGLSALVSAVGVGSISGFAWVAGGVLGGAFGLVTRFVLERGLAFFSNKNSTPNSGFSSGFDSGIGSDFAMAFALGSALNPLVEPSFAAGFAFGMGGISNSDDLGAALALAVDFLSTTGFGGSTTGLTSGGASLAIKAFDLVERLRLSASAGSAFVATAVFAIPAARGAFLMARFFGDFAAFKVFAPALARLALARRTGGFAAAVFFGFFMTTVLRWLARLLRRLSPVFPRRNK
jgi:hypothetical protein